MPLEKLYDVNELAEHLRSSPWSVRRWEFLGKLKATRAAGRVLFKESDVLEFLEAGRPAKRHKPKAEKPAAPAPAPGKPKKGEQKVAQVKRDAKPKRANGVEKP